MDDKGHIFSSNTNFTSVIVPPTSIKILDAVTIYHDGRVEVNPKYSTDEAATLFWEAVVRLAPNFFNKETK